MEGVPMAWETGWYYLNEGQSGEYWVSWGGTPQGLQFITAEPRGGNARLDTTTHGLVSLPQFGAPPKDTYWVTVTNRGPGGTNFVLTGNRVG